MDARWVLVTDGGSGGSRDCVACVRALAAGGYLPAVTVSRSGSPLRPSRYSVKRVSVPAVWEQGYAEAVHNELVSGDYLTVLPASEEALVALGAPAAHLSDKVGLEQAARKAGLAVPESRAFDSFGELLSAGDDLDYPVIVKPTIRRYKAFRAASRVELERSRVDDGPVVVQRYVEEGLRAVAGVMWRGRLLAAAHERWLRIWPVDCGLACAAETVAPNADLEKRLTDLLSGYDGIFVAQFAGPYLFDVNLRVHSTHPLAVAAGVNLVALYCDLLRGKEVVPVRARPGAFYRWLEGDVRHIARAVRQGRLGAGSAARALLPRWDAAHSTESLRDPGPLLSRLWYAARRIHMPEDARMASTRR